MLLPGVCSLSFSGTWIERRSSASVDPFGFHVGELDQGAGFAVLEARAIDRRTSCALIPASQLYA